MMERDGEMNNNSFQDYHVTQIRREKPEERREERMGKGKRLRIEKWERDFTRENLTRLSK